MTKTSNIAHQTRNTPISKRTNKLFLTSAELKAMSFKERETYRGALFDELDKLINEDTQIEPE